MDAYFPNLDESSRARLSRLATTHASSAQDLFAEWQAFAVKTGSSEPQGAVLDAFQESLEKSPVKVKSRPRLRPNAFGQNLGKSTAVSAVQALQVRAVTPVSSFNTQPESFAAAPASGFEMNTNLELFSARPFHQQFVDISAELDAEIETVVSRVVDARGIAKSDVTSAKLINQSPVYVVGRLLLASDNDEDDVAFGGVPGVPGAAEDIKTEPIDQGEVKGSIKGSDPHRSHRHQSMASAQWFIQAPRRLGGAITPLNLSTVDPDSKRGLFEGAIVCLVGKNAKGEDFLVSDIVDLPPVPVASVKSKRPSNTTLRVACMVGPRSAAELHSFLTLAREQFNAAAVIVLGPLSTRIADTSAVLNVLSEHSRAYHVPIVVVPSPNDALTADPLFPQPPLNLTTPTLPLPLLTPSQIGANVVSMSNPCTFSLDEAAITAANVGVLADIGIPFESACRQILRQKRIYPVYPARASTNVDITHLNLACIDGAAPNIMILPAAAATASSSEARAAIVDDVLCVSVPLDGIALLDVHPGGRSVAMRTSVEVYAFED